MSVFEPFMATISVAAAVNRLELVQSATGAPVQLRAAGADTNIGVAIVPLGTGALTARLPDNTASGGNARGAGAVDWQTVRTAAPQVASGATSVIGGGQNNLASQANATIAGGFGNTASGGGGTVAGGLTNTASGTNATVGGGASNAATNSNATVAGGRGNMASGPSAVVAGGGNATWGNTASGSGSWVPGGYGATTRGIFGRGAWSGLPIAAVGDNQAGEHQLGRQTTDATQTRLTADNAAPSTNNQIILPNFAAYGGRLWVVARAAGGGMAAWDLFISAERGANAAATTVQGGGASIAPTQSAGGGSAWRLAVTADTTNGGIALDATGAAAATIIWTARFAGAEAVPGS